MIVLLEYTYNTETGQGGFTRALEVQGPQMFRPLDLDDPRDLAAYEAALGDTLS